jgi:K+-sensing histidine kinase KdpD
MASSSVPSAAWWQSTSVVRGAAVLAPLVVCLVLSGFRDSVPAASAVLVLVLCVVAAAATGDRLAGVVAALSSALWFDFFLTEPYNRLTIDDPDDIQAAVLLVVIGVAVTELAIWGRRQQAHAALRAGYLDGVLAAAATVSRGEAGPDEVVHVVAAHIADVLGADSCRYVAGPVRDPRVALLDHEGVLTQNGHQRDVDRTGLPVDEYVAVEVRRATRVVGHFEVTAATHVVRPSREQCRVAVLLADQVAPLVDD